MLNLSWVNAVHWISILMYVDENALPVSFQGLSLIEISPRQKRFKRCCLSGSRFRFWVDSVLFSWFQYCCVCVKMLLLSASKLLFWSRYHLGKSRSNKYQLSGLRRWITLWVARTLFSRFNIDVSRPQRCDCQLTSFYSDRRSAQANSS